MTDLSFSEVLQEEQDQGRPCDLGRELDDMSPELRKEVRGAMADPKWSAAAISRTLGKFGVSVSEGSVRRCRRLCDCWKDSDDAA